jgi:hypothetical protein
MPGPTSIWAKLEKPASLSVSGPRPPDMHDVPGCTQASAKSPVWRLSSIRLRKPPKPYIPFAIVEAPSNETIVFDLNNSANGYTVRCWGHNPLSNGEIMDAAFSDRQAVFLETPNGPRMFFYCENTWSQSYLDYRRPDVTVFDYVTNATRPSRFEALQYDLSKTMFIINQTWYCDDEGADKP